MGKTKRTPKPSAVQAPENPPTLAQCQGPLEIIKAESADLSGALQALYDLHESGGEADPIGLYGLFAVLQRQAWHIHESLEGVLQKAFPAAKEGAR
jgi:hypothetical protein